jgi:hypothetical protein
LGIINIIKQLKLKVRSSWLQRSVVRRFPDVSEEHIASIFRVEEYVKQETNRSRRQGERTARGKSDPTQTGPNLERTMGESMEE